MFSSQQFCNYHKSAAKNAFLHISSEFLHKMFAHFMINLLCAFNCHTHTTLAHTHTQTDSHTTISKQNIRAFEMQKLTRFGVFWMEIWIWIWDAHILCKFRLLVNIYCRRQSDWYKGECYTADDPLTGRGTHTHVKKRLKPKPEQKIFN